VLEISDYMFIQWKNKYVKYFFKKEKRAGGVARAVRAPAQQV
jgi:hypothetical protein